MCDQVKLSNLVKQYSQFISFPIKLYSPKKEPIKVVDEDATRRKQAAADKKALEKAEESKPVSGTPKDFPAVKQHVTVTALQLAVHKPTPV